MRTTLRKTWPVMLVIVLLAACSSPGPTLPRDASAPGVALPDSLVAAPGDSASAPAWGGFIGSSGE